MARGGHARSAHLDASLPRAKVAASSAGTSRLLNRSHAPNSPERPQTKAANRRAPEIAPAVTHEIVELHPTTNRCSGKPDLAYAARSYSCSSPPSRSHLDRMTELALPPYFLSLQPWSENQ